LVDDWTLVEQFAHANANAWAQWKASTAFGLMLQRWAGREPGVARMLARHSSMQDTFVSDATTPRHCGQCSSTTRSHSSASWSERGTGHV
jgi:hypothetical protein